MMRLLLLASLSFANQENAHHHLPLRFDVKALTNPVRIGNLRKLEQYVHVSKEGDIGLQQFLKLLVEIKQARDLMQEPVIVQFHSSHRLFTIRYEYVPHVEIFDPDKTVECNILKFRSEPMSLATLQKILGYFQ